MKADRAKTASCFGLNGEHARLVVQQPFVRRESPLIPGDSGPAIAFVGSLVSDAFCESSPACSVAGNKFLKNLIGGVEAAAEGSAHVISFVPASMFPRGRQIFFGAGTRVLEDGRRVASVFFINLPVVKQITQALGIFVPLVRWLWANRSSRRVVIVYNVFSPHSIPVLAATRLLGGKAVAFIADLPHDFYDFRGWRAVLQRIDLFVQARIIAWFDGQVALTQKIIEDFAPGTPALLIEGGVEQSEASMLDPDDRGGKRSGGTRLRTCMFSGTLNDINGVELLLDAFQRIPYPEYRLFIFGRGPLEARIRERAAHDHRIIYGGFLPNAEIGRRQREATVLINPRPSHREITRYTFPSKLLEYMLSGRPVVTTVLPGIPDEYHPFLFLVREETPEGLAAVIQEVCERDPAEVARHAERARDFVLREKNWRRQGERVYNFVSEL